jgi:hypothetical protein
MRLFLALLLSCSIAKAATIIAVNPGPVAVSNAMQLVSAGDTLSIPAGLSNWTYGIAWTAPSNVTVIGAGTTATGGGDQTVIVDNNPGNSPIFDITLASSGTFRFSGISVIGGNGAIKDEEGVIRFLGPTNTGQIRVDHCRFDNQIYSPALTSGTHMPVFFNLTGVVDHCIMSHAGNSSLYIYRSGSSLVGDETWAADTGFGTSDFLYLEDNIINGGSASLVFGDIPSRVWDMTGGGKAVCRFNTLYFCSGGEIHATGHAGNDRGGRAAETYGNLYALAANESITERNARAMADTQGGTSLVWGNTAETGAIQSLITLNTVRKNSITYPQSPNPTGWGYAGPVPVATGTVSVTATAVTKTGGTDFSLLWPAGTMIYIVGMTAVGVLDQEPSPGPTAGIASVISTTSITLQNGGHTGAPLTGAAYFVGSAWDGNTTAYGYPAIDQTGRGRGDLLTGSHPTKINSTTGTIAWPNQALEPVYVFNNTATPTVTAYSNADTNRIASDRDYYAQASGIQTSPTSPFDGTSGTGWGTIANRPATCTTGVGYFATDQGSWNTSTSNPYGVQQNGADGVLYKATAPNTWTLYYTPYTYPHPLQGTTVQIGNNNWGGSVRLNGKGNFR